MWIGQRVSEVRVSILCLIMVNFYFIQRLCLRKGLSLNKLSSRFWIVNHKAKLLPDRIGISCVGSATKSSLFSGYIINHLLAKLFGQDGFILAGFFSLLLTLTSTRSIKTQKEARPTSGHLDLSFVQ